MNCGNEIRVKDWYGSIVMRFIAICPDRFIVITSAIDGRNGWILNDWRAVLRELITVTVPAKMTDRVRTVECSASEMLYLFPMTYPLSVQSLAGLLGAPVDEVAAQLADLAVAVE